jgi:hypothetical protein
VAAEMPESRCCKHCAEIPRLREEIAELRARLDVLTGTPRPAMDGQLILVDRTPLLDQ